MRVGLVGLGRMGTALVPHLVRGCSCVVAWNRTLDRSGAAAAAGARIVQSLREVVDNSDVVLSILFDDAAVEEVYLGPEGLLARACDERVFVEMSTIRPDTIHRIAGVASERNASLVDAPVSGSVGPAREGKLLVLAGGAAADVARVHPILSLFARRVVHMGGTGSGICMKLALQLPIYVYWQSLAEALSIGVRSGLDVSEMLALLADSPAALATLKAKIPVILQQDNAIAFPLAAAGKDLGVIIETAQALGVPLPAASAALASYRAAVRAGWGEQDVARLVRFLLEGAQLPGDKAV